MYFNHILSFTAAITQISFFLIVWLHTSLTIYFFFIVIQYFSSWANIAYFTKTDMLKSLKGQKYLSSAVQVFIL